MRIHSSLALFGASLALAGCNETMGGGAGGPVATAPPPDISLSLPAGAACSREINQFQSIVKADLATGNVEQRVYDEIQREMSRAAAACSAGRGGEAHSIVAGSKVRHGYRA